jgi:hypothetical protein
MKLIKIKRKDLLSKEERIQQAFYLQKIRAEQRGIEFLFLFEDWIRWWEDNLGPDWLYKRGIKSGQFVMARDNDAGPYDSWNVECITVNENHRRRAYSGRVGNRKLTAEQAIEIYRSNDIKAAIARKYGICNKQVKEIKTGRQWGTITKHSDKKE